MKNLNNKKQRLRIFVISALLISIISISGFVAYAMQPVSIPLEVKEPLTIIDYPTSFSLYAGETTNFEFTIENHASVTIFQEFEFKLNNTDYQTNYVTFSNHNYSISPGINKLSAWLTIASSAPQENFIITVNKKTDTPTPTPTPTPTSNSDMLATVELLSGAARWAAQEGKSVLYINWKDNYENHHNTDGVNWPYPPESHMDSYRILVTTALEASGFTITYSGDIPDDLTSYDLIVAFAYFAIEPHHESIIRDYVYNGGNIVLLSGAPTYLTMYSKTMKTGYDLTSIEDWFGASKYQNAEGSFKVAFDNPFGTSIRTNESIRIGTPGYYAAVNSLSDNSEEIAFWESGSVFAFTHEYGSGRVYYQASFERRS